MLLIDKNIENKMKNILDIYNRININQNDFNNIINEKENSDKESPNFILAEIFIDTNNFNKPVKIINSLNII